MTTLVRAACLTHYAEVARSLGLDPARMLRDVDLPPRCLTDPELRISVQAVRQLLENSAALSKQEAFALLMAEGRRVSNLGVVGMLMREEPTLRAALQSIVSYGRAHNEALVQRIEEAQGIATLYEELLIGSAGPSHQGTELVVAVALKAMRFFLGADWRARRVCFMHAPPADLSVHRRVLGQTPEFGADFNGIVCTSADLDTPIASADPIVASYIRQQAQSRTEATMSVADEVRQMVLVMMPQGRCTVDQVARQMGVTRRTLHRHLADEGEVFTDLVLAIRRELASRYVSEGQQPLTEVSQRLGFSDLSSFSRWYRSVFGATAMQQRRAAPVRRRVVSRG